MYGVNVEYLLTPFVPSGTYNTRLPDGLLVRLYCHLYSNYRTLRLFLSLNNFPPDLCCKVNPIPFMLLFPTVTTR